MISLRGCRSTWVYDAASIDILNQTFRGNLVALCSRVKTPSWTIRPVKLERLLSFEMWGSDYSLMHRQILEERNPKHNIGKEYENKSRRIFSSW